MQRRLEGSHKGSPLEGRRCGKIEDIKGLCSDERRAVSQNARRNFIKMCGARGGAKKARGCAQQNLWVLWGV